MKTKIDNKPKTYFKDFEGDATFFVTMVCYNRHILLSTIENEEVQLSIVGIEISDVWAKIPERFPQAELGEFVFMPDHFHGIVKIRHKSEKEKISIGKIIHWFKTRSSVQFSKFRMRTGFIHSPHLWQRGYNEKWIGKDPELEILEQYIRDNPKKWPGVTLPHPDLFPAILSNGMTYISSSANPLDPTPIWPTFNLSVATYHFTQEVNMLGNAANPTAETAVF